MQITHTHTQHMADWMTVSVVHMHVWTADNKFINKSLHKHQL